MMVPFHCDDRNKIWQLASGNQETWSGIEAMTRAFLPHPRLCKAPLRLPGQLLCGCSLPAHWLPETTFTENGGQIPKQKFLNRSALITSPTNFKSNKITPNNNFKSNKAWRGQQMQPMRPDEITSCTRVGAPARAIKLAQGLAIRECEDERS